MTNSREDIADAIYGDGVTTGVSSWGGGDVLGAILWSTSLYFTSPWQLLLIFLGRVDTERPSDWFMDILGKTAGYRSALLQRNRMPLQSPLSMQYVRVGSPMNARFEKLLVLFASWTVGGDKQADSHQTWLYACLLNSNPCSTLPVVVVEQNIMILCECQSLSRQIFVERCTNNALCACSVTKAEYSHPFWIRAAAVAFFGGCGASIAWAFSAALGDATWSVSTGLGCCFISAIYEVGRPDRLSSEEAQKLEDQYADFGTKVALLLLQYTT